MSGTPNLFGMSGPGGASSAHDSLPRIPPLSLSVSTPIFGSQGASTPTSSLFSSGMMDSHSPSMMEASMHGSMSLFHSPLMESLPWSSNLVHVCNTYLWFCYER